MGPLIKPRFFRFRIPVWLQVRFTPTAAGQHSIIVLLGPDPIKGSPFTPYYRSSDGPLIPAQTRVVNQAGVELFQLPVLVAGASSTQLVQAYTLPQADGTLSPKDLGGDSVVPVLANSVSGSVPLPTTDLTNGRYSFVVANITVAGQYAVIITASCVAIGCSNGTQLYAPSGSLRASPYLLVVRAAASSPLTTSAVELANPASLYGWLAGQQLMFTIQARDKYGNVQLFDASADNRIAFDVALRGADLATNTTQIEPTGAALAAGQLTVVWQSDGLYVVNFLLSKAQTYTATALMLGAPIRNTPAAITISPNTVDAPSSTVEVNAMGGSVGAYLNFIIRAYDAYGNQQSSGGQDFRVDLFMTNIIDWWPGVGTNPLSVSASANPAAGSTYATYANASFAYSPDSFTIYSFLQASATHVLLNNRFLPSCLLQKTSLWHSTKCPDPAPARPQNIR